MYDNDLPNSTSCSARLYADDTCFVLHDNDVSQLEQKINLELKKTWFDSNKLTLNIKKTAGMLIQPTVKLKSFQFNISLCNEQIPLVESYKHLGIHLDNKLCCMEQHN